MVRGLTLLTCCLLCAAVLAQTKPQTKPSLEETVRWMTSFSEAHGQLYRGTTLTLMNRLSGTGCKLQVLRDYPKPTEKGPKSQETELALADFDPRVKVDSDDDQNEYQVVLERTDAQMKTHEVMEYRDGRKLEMWTAQVDLFFDSEESAKRFAKAMSHAISLCGGSAAPF